ncbi:MAG: hypothetical protein IH939_05575 [Acidobacteria bacterium]|nr:hypothetical protein [Acidobacteriota bacterium]
MRRVPIPAIGQYARKVTDGLALMPRAVRNHISKEIGMDVGDGSWVDTVTMSKDLTQRLKLLQSGDVQPSPSRRGRKGRGDAFYARIAQTYATEAEKGTRRGMLEIIRKQHRLATINHARAAVYRAREMKFLEGRQLGVVSGALTDKARAILTPPRRTVTRSPATRKKAIPGPSKRTRTRRR